ncbi:MAG TPA: family 16 glycoside hydrolase, partial [Chthonomonadales bacterium]|nr:family 16 glycoside hydrolase [Chthonomonadales bacterium]
IIFRVPRFDENGKITERPRATVFQNGILIQNNEEFPRMTGIQYSQYSDEAKTGPVILQGDHNPVHFRSVWVVPL